MNSRRAFCSFTVFVISLVRAQAADAADWLIYYPPNIDISAPIAQIQSYGGADANAAVKAKIYTADAQGNPVDELDEIQTNANANGFWSVTFSRDGGATFGIGAYVIILYDGTTEKARKVFSLY